MPAPLCEELRERIIIKHQKGMSAALIREQLELRCLATVYNIINLHAETGGVAAKPLNNGRKPKLSAEALEAVRVKISAQPDITLEELQETLELPVCISALCRTVNNKLKLPIKKRRSFRKTRRALMS